MESTGRTSSFPGERVEGIEAYISCPTLKVIDGVTRRAATARVPFDAVVGQNRAEPAIQHQIGVLSSC